jgi:dTDP-4-amino-4,6-dideoxygalactose transaminase
MSANPTSTPGAVKVPLLDLTAQYRAIQSEIDETVDRVLASGRYIMGPEVQAFEQEAAAYCTAPHAIGCASGTDALILALRALGIGHGDEVVTPAYSFQASASAISLCGAQPVFCDIDPATYNMDPAKLAAAITPKTKAVIVVHLFGQCAEMPALLEIARGRALPVIEDAAQAIGAEWQGRRAGSMGVLGCFSFFPSKNLGAYGDGGMVTGTDERLADRVRLLREHGARPKYHHLEIGYNSRLDALQAAVLRVKLRHLEGWTEARRRNADTYRERLAGAAVGLPLARPEARHIYNQFVIRHARRDDLRAQLQAANVGTEVYYPRALHLQPCYAGLGLREGDFPAAEAASRETMALPIYPELTSGQIAYVTDRVREFAAA